MLIRPNDVNVLPLSGLRMRMIVELNSVTGRWQNHTPFTVYTNT